MIEVVGIEKLNQIILSIIAARVQSRRLQGKETGENSFRWKQSLENTIALGSYKCFCFVFHG